MATTVNPNKDILPLPGTVAAPASTGNKSAETGLFANEAETAETGDTYSTTKTNENPDSMEDFEDIMTDDAGYETRKLNCAAYTFHYDSYKRLQNAFGQDWTFRQYLQYSNIGMSEILQKIENYIETGNSGAGDGVNKNLLNETRSYRNPDNPNQEIYWNEDKSKYYMFDWDKGEYRCVDPEKLPFKPEMPPDDPKDWDAQPIPPTPTPPPGEPVEDDPFKRLEELDPVGYKDKDGNSFDFVIDRNKDGVFNGPEEFLGALNNWSEVEKLDKDGNGIVEGSELAGLMLLKTGANGVQNFVNAIAMNIKIYLDSYFEAKKGEKDENDQTLLGNFDISVDGETHRGYNTLDSMDFLNEKYGNMFDKKLA